MKHYKKIYSFGCSFTEGGGLNSQNYHRYLNGQTNYSSIRESILPEHAEYTLYHSYPGYLSRLLNCEFENYGTSRAANELILNMAYDKINNMSVTAGILVTIQTSILTRMLLQLPDKNKQITINGTADIGGSTKTFYEMYISEFFDVNYSCKKLLQQIDIFNAWFSAKNIDIVWLLYDMDESKIPINNKHIINFDNKNLCNYTRDNKLTLRDLPNFPINDTHFSVLGNETISKKIYEHLKKYYD